MLSNTNARLCCAATGAVGPWLTGHCPGGGQFYCCQTKPTVVRAVPNPDPRLPAPCRLRHSLWSSECCPCTMSPSLECPGGGSDHRKGTRKWSSPWSAGLWPVTSACAFMEISPSNWEKGSVLADPVTTAALSQLHKLGGGSRLWTQLLCGRRKLTQPHVTPSQALATPAQPTLAPRGRCWPPTAKNKVRAPRQGLSISKRSQVPPQVNMGTPPGETFSATQQWVNRPQ